jgi:transposase-like protein
VSTGVDDYPRDLTELEEWFGTDDACRNYLEKLRWPDGFCCPRCGGQKVWYTSGLLRCGACQYKASVTAGTIFQDTRKPLTLWFRAIWWVVSQKYGASAKGVQRILELGSYQTAWVWLHKLRRAMVRPDRDKLVGTIEIDETYVGGEKPGKRGRGALGKALVAVAIEDKGKEGMGRVRLSVVTDASQESLSQFVRNTVEPDSTIRTDDWSGYGTLTQEGYQHVIVPSHDLKIVHLAISLMKRWLVGTHQGAVSHEHLAYYLDEYTFRFNRRRASHRGLLFYRLLQNAMQMEPTTYRQMVRHVRGPKPKNHNMLGSRQ